MALSVREKADTVATWRYVAVHLMEMLARWVPTAPELEAKALFGRHIWELAQLADQLGHRTAELRAALHQNREPRPEYLAALATLSAAKVTGERLAGFYDAVLPDLARRLVRHQSTADPLLDEPTIRIVERAHAALTRMVVQRDALLAERPDLKSYPAAALSALRVALAAVDDAVDYRPAPAGVG